MTLSYRIFNELGKCRSEPIRSEPSSASVIPRSSARCEYQQYGDNGHCDGGAESVRSATGEQFGLRVVSQQVDGIARVAARW